MKYFISQLVLLIMSVIILYYLGTLTYFKPQNSDSSLNWYNLITVLTLLALAAESVVSIATHILLKVFIYGRKEHPPVFRSLKWGICAALLVPILFLLNIFHILSLEWGVLIVLVFVIGFKLLK
jgi:hypothetical protein